MAWSVCPSCGQLTHAVAPAACPCSCPSPTITAAAADAKASEVQTEYDPTRWFNRWTSLAAECARLNAVAP